MSWKRAEVEPVVRAYEREVGNVVIRKMSEQARLRQVTLKFSMGAHGLALMAIVHSDEEADALAPLMNRLAEMAKDMQP